MDPKKNTSSTTGNGHASNAGMSVNNRGPDTAMPGTTGRYLVLMRRDGLESGIKLLSEKAGIRNIARATDFDEGAIPGDRVTGADALVFDKLEVAVVDAMPDQIRTLGIGTEANNAILAIEPERIVYALQEQRPREMERFMPPMERFMSPPFAARRFDYEAPPNNMHMMPVEYLQGYRDAVNSIVDKVLVSAGMPADTEGAAIAARWSELEMTWGLQATKAAMSRFSGKGIRIAVLDTGLDLTHPDFAGRKITVQSFMPDEEVQDGNGHGTHCIGTACGPLLPHRLPRYGIAYESEIYAGKVLSNQGRGNDSGILAGIHWAITQGCQIVSMSLGAPVQLGDGFSQVFEEVASRALEAGTLIVAAAGNDSHRPFRRCPVNHPANCPSIMAVGALSKQLGVAFFSNAGINPHGGQVDIVAPGEEVISSWRQPQLYNDIDGTSMATPHVAGIAALLAEAHPEMRGRALAGLLVQTARRLEWSACDVGAGLVQAP